MVKNTKTLKVVVCMSLIIALAISALGLSVRAVYENTHNNSGNQASDIVGVATTQVGYGEGGDGYTKYGDWYGLPYSDWCAMFVSWCANQAGVSTDVFPRFALCSAGADWFISQGRFHYAGSYAPQAGDLIFYASYGNIYHVGLVTGSDSSNVYSIEGNYNEAVYNVSYPLGYGDILGYATPAYGTQEPVLLNTAVEETSEPEEIEEIDSEEDEPAVYYDTEEDDEDSEEVTASSDEDTAEDEYEDEIVESDTASEDTDTETDEEESDDDISVLIGDVNDDGVIDSADALLIQRYLAGKLSDNENFRYIAADMDGSGEIDVEDALLVLEKSIEAA